MSAHRLPAAVAPPRCRLLVAVAVLTCLAGGPGVSTATAAAATCAGRAPLDLHLVRLHGSHAQLRWHAPAATPAPPAYRVLLAGRTVGQTTHTVMSMPIVPGRPTTFTVQARYAGAVCSTRLRNRLPLRPPTRVLGLRLLGHTATGVRISWRRARPGDAPIAGYRVMRDGAVVAQTRARTFAVKLSAGRAHRLTVAAVDTRGHLGPPSRPLDIGGRPGAVTTHADAAAGTLPGAPGSLSVSEVSEAGATAWWTPAVAGAQRIIGYRVYRDGSLVGQVTADTLRLTHLAPLHTYEIAVAAVDALHREGPRTPTLKLSTSHLPPGGSSLISALSVTDTSATLSWQPGHANSGTLVGYLLFENGSPEGVVHGLTTTVSLASNQTYTFTVRALDSFGYLSAPAPNLTVLTTHTPPSTPGELHATEVGESSATLAWSPSTPVSGTIVGYRVFRNGLPIGQTAATSMAVTDLASETSYTITVQAVDSLGAVSAPTAPLTVQTANPTPTHGHVQAFLLASTDQSFFDLEAHYQQVGVVYPTYFECGASGALLGQDYPLVTDWALARHVEVMPRLNCQNPADEEAILNEPAVGAHMIEQLAAACREHGYSGIQVDFEGAPPAEREPFTAWIAALASALHSQGDKLSTIVTAKYYNITSGRAAMYNDAALSAYSDYIFVLDWGLHWTTSGPGGIDEMPWFKRVAEYTATMPNREKFILGMPMYGIDWANGGGPGNPGTPLEYNEIEALEERLRRDSRMGRRSTRPPLLLHRRRRRSPRSLVHRRRVDLRPRRACPVARPGCRALAPRQRGPVDLGTALARRLNMRSPLGALAAGLLLLTAPAPVLGASLRAPPDAPTGASTQNPSPPAPLQAFVLAGAPDSFADLQAHASAIGVIYPTYYECSPSGPVQGAAEPALDAFALARSLVEMPRFSCQNGPLVHRILTARALRARVLTQLETLALSYAGLNLDLENDRPSDRSAFTTFVAALAARLHLAGRRLAVDVAGVTSELPRRQTYLYDDPALAALADTVFVMAWGVHWERSAPGPLAPLPYVRAVAARLRRLPHASRFVLGIPLYGLDWPALGGPSQPATPLPYAAAVSLAQSVGATPARDGASGELSFSYTRAGTAHHVWFPDARAVAQRIDIAHRFGLAAGLWRLGQEDAGVWGVLGG